MFDFTLIQFRQEAFLIRTLALIDSLEREEMELWYNRIKGKKILPGIFLIMSYLLVYTG